MRISISQQVADELVRPTPGSEVAPPPEIDVAATLLEIERRQREVHAAVLELRALVEELRLRCQA